jgi:hypothetical protein
MENYTVDEIYHILKANKITTNKESVRRWLRQGVIKGARPSSRKEGWLVSPDALHDFLQRGCQMVL